MWIQNAGRTKYTRFSMHKRVLFYSLLAIIVFSFASCGGCRKTRPETVGCDSTEELAQKYLQAISTKNNDLFTSLLLTKDDLKPFAKLNNKQGFTVYQQFVLRDFQIKNRELLGKPLKFVVFKLGREVKSTDQWGLYRGSTIIAEYPDGDGVKKINLEVNFVSRLNKKWKIFSLRYIKDAKGANPGVPEILPGAKFGPEKGKVQMKIKKVEPKPGAAPAAKKQGTTTDAPKSPAQPEGSAATESAPAPQTP
jgi:hypothetical protein